MSIDFNDAEQAFATAMAEHEATDWSKLLDIEWPEFVALQREKTKTPILGVAFEELNPDVLAKPLRVSFGKNMRDMNFLTQNLTLGQLIKQDFAGFQRGPKDGRCILQGECVGGQRIAKNMKANQLVLIDCDTGESPDVIADKIEAHGLFAVVYTTHSHLKTQSEFAEDKFVRWTMKQAGDVNGEDLTELAKQYMASETKIDPGIIASVTHARLDFDVGGKKLFVTHAPMPRVRALFVLAEDYSFAVGQQSARITEWKERVAGFATKLGLPYDRSGVDPSRLMFTPRIGQGADESLHSIIYCNGRAVTLDDMPRLVNGKVEKSAEENAFAEAADEVGVKAAREKIKYQTKGMARFAATHAHAFHPTMFFEHFGIAQRGSNGTHISYPCPNEDAHSKYIPDGQGFWCIDAENTENGFTMQCSHDSCKTMYNNDRMRFLDKACENVGLTDARDLLQFCPGHEYDNLEDEIAEEVAAKEGGLEELIAALDNKSQPATIQKALKTLVKSNLSDIENERHIAEVVRLTKVSKKTISKTFDEYKREEVAATSDEGNVVAVQRPVPTGAAAARANIIWTDWPYSAQKDVSVAAFTAKNAKNPRVFARSEGGHVRLTTLGTKMLLEEMSAREDWVYEIDKHLTFKEADAESAEEHDVPPIASVVGHFIGNNEMALPLIERIVNVPVFGADGSLRTEKGYDAATRTYLWPTGEFLDVPPVVTTADVEEALYWLYEPLRDIPFSDVFDGTESAPILLEDELDGDGYPALNEKRGQSSRANYLAMLLQPFARNLIDGECPQYHVDKPKAGTGASLLISMRHEVAAGGKVASISLNGKSEDEINKLVTALLREGSDCLPFDNLDEAIKSPSLAELATSGLWRGRILGVSRTVDMIFNGTIIFAGNNTPFDSQMLRRNVPIRIDANTPDPAKDRQTFKYPELKRWVKAHRKQLVWSCHVLVKNWIQAGCPKSTTARLASFEVWAGVMGGILEGAGVEGFLVSVVECFETVERVNDWRVRVRLG